MQSVAVMGEIMLTARRLPARLTVEQTAMLLGFVEHEITILMAAGVLQPLGDPAPNGHKFFWTREILQLGEDRKWLDKATKAVARHWRLKNQNRQKLALVTAA